MNKPNIKFFSKKNNQADIKNYIFDIRKSANKGLHLGAGYTKIEGLINCDLYNPEADMKVDSTNLVDFDDGSVDLIETHHMIEHLSFENVDIALNEWSRVLKSNGHLIITCPDLTYISFLWLKLFVKSFFVNVDNEIAYALKMIYGSQENDGMFHRSGFDKKCLIRYLNKYGFDVCFTHTPYPIRPTPSLLVVARKI